MTKLDRRGFLGAAAGTAVAASLARGAEQRKLRLGLIGAGWYGMVDVKAALKVGGVEIVAICDVDTEHLKNSADEIEKLQGLRPKTFKLYERLLETSNLDAVIIATPPHWHALQFIAACEKGLDVYCEKPLSYDVREGRAMVDAWKKAGNIVQVGFQRRQSKAIRQAAEYVRSGKPGELVQVNANIHYAADPGDPTIQDPPESLDWELWCGPAPKLPYRPSIGHFKWRLEKAYGHGHLVDWGIHLIDAIRVALDLGTPHTIQAPGGIYHFRGEISTPDVLTAHFEFDRCPVIWTHRIWGSAEYSPEVSNGIFFRCENETVFTSDRTWMIIPKGNQREIDKKDVPADLGPLHMAEFLEAVRARRQPVCTPDDAFRSTAMVQLGMIAHESGTKVKWDAEKEQITGNPEAAKLLKREYRKPWQHPYANDEV